MKWHPPLLRILCSSTWTLATIEGSFDPLVPSRQSAWDFSICRGLNILWPCDLVDSKSVFQLPWHFFYVSSIFSRFSHREIHGRAATFGKNLPDTSATRSFTMNGLGGTGAQQSKVRSGIVRSNPRQSEYPMHVYACLWFRLWFWKSSDSCRTQDQSMSHQQGLEHPMDVVGGKRKNPPTPMLQESFWSSEVFFCTLSNTRSKRKGGMCPTPPLVDETSLKFKPWWWYFASTDKKRILLGNVSVNHLRWKQETQVKVIHWTWHNCGLSDGTPPRWPTSLKFRQTCWPHGLPRLFVWFFVCASHFWCTGNDVQEYPPDSVDQR